MAPSRPRRPTTRPTILHYFGSPRRPGDEPHQQPNQPSGQPSGQSSGQSSGQPFQPLPHDDILARWLASTDHAATDRTGWGLWQLVNNPTYAELWYEARAAGERWRASAITALYARNARPGGRHPDPRGRAAYSESAILAQAYRSLGIDLWPQAPCVHHDPNEPTVLLMTYHPADRMPPKLLVHAVTPDVPHGLRLFRMAAMLGYITREQTRLFDPDAPHGARLIPISPGLHEILHQFAFAFLCVQPQCPPEWGCQCNSIRQRYNAPPAGHEQPTDTLSLADLRAATQPPLPDQSQGGRQSEWQNGQDVTDGWNEDGSDDGWESDG